MRAAVLAIALSACAGAGGSRPVVSHNLMELPPDHKRDPVLDSARARPEPETRKGMTQKEKNVERGAAVGAAILGEIFSTTDNTNLGVETSFDETGLIKPRTLEPIATEPPPPPPTPEAKELVPWIQLAPTAR